MTQVLTANDLLHGDVVFRGAGGWVEHISDADVYDETAGPAALAAAEGQPTVVVAPYLIDVVPTDGVPVPVSYRERIRATGPTDRRNLGKQTEAPAEAAAIDSLQTAARSTGRVALIKRAK